MMHEAKASVPGDGRTGGQSRRWAWTLVIFLMLGLAWPALSASASRRSSKSSDKKDPPAIANPLLPGGSLEASEKAGGHLLARHVGKTEEELRQRLKSDPKISAASSFKDRASAEEGITAAIMLNSKRIEDWLKGKQDRLVFVYKHKKPIGISVARNAPQAREAFFLRLVLVRDSRFEEGWKILTGYPEL